MTLVLILLIPCILGVAVLYCFKKQKESVKFSVSMGKILL